MLDGNFKINWNGVVLGYWVDMDGDKEKICQLDTDGITVTVYDIPQKIIKKYLTGNDALINFVPIDDPELSLNEELNEKILERRKEIKKENEFLTHIYPNAEYKSEETTNNKEPSEVISEEKVENKNIHTSNESIKNEINTLEKCRVLVGKDKYTNEIFWEFGNKQLANRHLLITGTSGQGKTYCIQSMLYELSKNKISSLVFDYTEGFRKDQLDPMFIEKMQNKIHQHFIYNEGVPINPFKIQDIIFEGNTVKEKNSDVAARIANVFKHVYNFGDQQFSAIFEAARKGLEEYGEEMNMSIFQEMLDKEKTNNKTAKSVLSKMSPFFHGIEFNTSSDFEWRKILYSDAPELTIFQLTNIDREMQVIITELMLWDAWYFTKKEGNKDKPFVTILDEAQNLSHKEKSPSASILTEGRKFGWSAWFATQSLKVLDDDEVTRLSQAATKLYFKPTNTELQRVAKIIEPSNWELQQSQLQNLKKGQCIFVGDRLGSNGKFGLGQPTITGITPFTERK